MAVFPLTRGKPFAVLRYFGSVYLPLNRKIRFMFAIHALNGR